MNTLKLCAHTVYGGGGFIISRQIYFGVFQDSNDDMLQKLFFNYIYSEGFPEDIYDMGILLNRRVILSWETSLLTSGDLFQRYGHTQPFAQPNTDGLVQVF